MNIQHNAYFNVLENPSQELCLNFYNFFYLFCIEQTARRAVSLITEDDNRPENG